jgi:MFS transporter, DHA1 family, multidrug resistance protein
VTSDNKNTQSKEFIFFTSCSMILTALGIDIMLPAFAELRRHFSLDNNSTETANLIAYFFMGQITQIVFGYLTDRMGRLPILRLGIIIYIICGIATIFVPSLSWMFVLRFISGMGSAAVFMTSIASVRDRFAGDAMARVMSFALTILLLTPIFAPTLGAFVLQYYSWKAVFLIPPIFAILVLIWSFRMKESHPKEARTRDTLMGTLPKLKVILTDVHFLRYTIAATLLFSILSCYVSSSERIVGEIYQKPALFPFIFGSMGVLMAIFSLSNSYISKKIGARRALFYYLIAYLTITILLVTAIFILGDPPQLFYFFALMSLILSLTLAADPNSSAIALEFMGDKAGLAASVYGTIFFFIGSGIGSVISNLLVNGIMPLAFASFILSFICLVLVFNDKNKII